MDDRPPITVYDQGDDVNELIQASAEACGFDRQIVCKVCPASEEQVHRMDRHIETGSYMMQIVLHYEGDLNRDFLLRVLSAIRYKNHVWRTRLIKYQGRVFQAILKDSILYQSIKVSIGEFLSRNPRRRMDYGTPLFRHAFIMDPHGESFLVLSVHCSVVDAWTLRLIFDDLQAACSDLEAYCKSPPRPPYGRYSTGLESQPPDIGPTFWLGRHTAFDNLKDKFPVIRLGDAPPYSMTRIKGLLHLPKSEIAGSSLCIVGHAAWTLAIANLHKRENPAILNEDISFISLTSARQDNSPGITEIMGPISARVPILVHLSPSLPIESLMHDILNQFSDMLGLEHRAMTALSNKDGSRSLYTQAVFNWNLPGCDVCSERIICHDREVAPAVLAYREDLSMPPHHDYGLLIQVYEHGEHISIYASWDPQLLSKDFVLRLLENFKSLVFLIMKTRGPTVLDVLDQNTERRPEQALDSKVPRNEAPRDKSPRDGTPRDKASSDETLSDKASCDETPLDKASRAEPPRAEPPRAEPPRAQSQRKQPPRGLGRGTGKP